MPRGFFKGNKYAKGGARPGAGPPTKATRAVKKLAAQIAAEFIEKHTREVLETYLKNAKGHYEERFTEDGKKYREWVVDPASTRHWVDKILPAAKQTLEVSGTFLKADIERTELRELSQNPEAQRLSAEFLEVMLKFKSSHGPDKPGD